MTIPDPRKEGERTARASRDLQQVRQFCIDAVVRGSVGRNLSGETLVREAAVLERYITDGATEGEPSMHARLAAATGAAVTSAAGKVG